VTVEYALASVIPEQSADFTIITGVLANSPNTREDLRPAYKDEANNGTSEVGYKWRDRLYDFTVRSHEHGMLYVVIGIWGTWEVRQKYYLDALQVTVTKKPDSAKFYSFESDLEGWTANASDTGLGTESSDWFISRMQEVPLGGEDGEYSIHFDLNNLTHNGKIWMERAFSVEPRRKYKVDLDYAFHHAYCAGPPPKFNIIAGVFRRHPESGEDILDAVREKTGVTKCLWGWMQKSYSFTIKSKKSDTLYAVIGIWDKDEAHRTYNVDSVCITITPK